MMRSPYHDDGRALQVAVIGAGISGLSAAWLLRQRHRVTLFEQAPRLGGHSRTLDLAVPRAQTPLHDAAGAAHAASQPVDIGFIVYNEATYPNLTALFAHLGVATRASDMSFSVSLDQGALEYAGGGPREVFAQRRNLLRPRFWGMLREIRRFYATAPSHLPHIGDISLGDYLALQCYGPGFVHDHILPMAAAIWSAPAAALLDHPAASFIRFFHNHGLLQLTDRPAWRTVIGGSRAYVERLQADGAADVRVRCRVQSVMRTEHDVRLLDESGTESRFDALVIATHADQALALLADATDQERALLGAFRYQRNDAIVHQDTALLPRRRAAWASWNYLAQTSETHGETNRPGRSTDPASARARGRRAADGTEAHRALCVTYWMNRLQGFAAPDPLLVTLNPIVAPREDRVIHRETFDHPVFDRAAAAAQRALWRLQGDRRTWFCGAYFGAGFHEDGLQAGLAAAESLGGVRRPWTVEHESGRITLDPSLTQGAALEPRSVETQA